MLLGEDLLLLLLGPDGKTLGRVRGPLAGAVVWDLAQVGAIRLDANGKHAMLSAPPADLDPLLRAAFDRLAGKPPKEASDAVRTLLDFAGPALRDRLAYRGMITPTGPSPFPDPTYRSAVVAHLQRVIAGEADADPRSAALIALIAMTGGISRLETRVNWPRIHAVQESSWITKVTQFVTGKPGSPDWLIFWN